MKRPLGTIAHTRSGDKGDTSNIGVIAFQPGHYPVILREVTPERVKEFFGEMVRGKVERFELPNLGAINLLLHEPIIAPMNGVEVMKIGFASHSRSCEPPAPK